MLFIKEARDGYAVGLGYQPDDERRELFWSDTLTNARAFSARLAALLTQPKIGRRLGPAKPDALVLSPQQVADVLGMSRATVDRMIAAGALPAVRFRQGKSRQ